MLGITKDFAERIDSCNWLKNCGSYDRIDFEFPVSIAKSRDEAMRSITTIHWENACIDARGDFDLLDESISIQLLFRLCIQISVL